MRTILFLCLCTSYADAARALRTWTLIDQSEIHGTLMYSIRHVASIRTPSGTVRQIPEEKLCQRDRNYLLEVFQTSQTSRSTSSARRTREDGGQTSSEQRTAEKRAKRRKVALYYAAQRKRIRARQAMRAAYVRAMTYNNMPRPRNWYAATPGCHPGSRFRFAHYGR